MGKNKIRRFAENETFSLLVQPSFDEVYNKDYFLKGQWNTRFFARPNPLVLELGCGRGEYTLALSSAHKDKNFIGVDIKGARLWRGAKTATEQALDNAGFLRIRIEFIASCFGPGEIDEIWLTFPDPQPKHADKRLISPRFLDRYRTFLKDGALIHLKTDSSMLYRYGLEVIGKDPSLQLLEAVDDIYKNPQTLSPLLRIRTHYEDLFLAEGRSIAYLCFGVSSSAAAEKGPKRAVPPCIPIRECP